MKRLPCELLPLRVSARRACFRSRLTALPPLRPLRLAAACLLAVCGATPAGFAQAFVAEWNAAAQGGIGPVGLVLANEGGVNVLYAADQPRGRVLKFNAATGAVTAVYGRQGNAHGDFNSPYGLARDAATGDIYVAERGNHRISRITSSGTFVMAWGALGTGAGQFNEPVGVAVDAAGDVYVTDHANHRVQKFRVAQTGGAWAATHLASWGTPGSGNGQFNLPYGITADAAGNLWIADGFNGRVQRFNPGGVYQSTLGGPGTAPGQFIIATWLGRHPSGDVLVTSTNSNPQDGTLADAANQWVSRFTSTGAFVSRFGGAFGGGPSQFRLPFAVVVDANNRAYVSDYYNSRVQIFDLNTAPGTGGGGTTPPDTTAPTVANFTIGTSTATSANFQIVFGETVTGVDAADFATVTTGGAVATIGAVTGTGTTYTIPVTFTGTGSVQLNLKASGTGIADAAANALATGATGPVHTINTTGGTTDTVRPTVASFAPGASTAASVTFSLTFSEAVTGVNSADFAAVTTGGASATIGPVAGSGAAYTIPVTFTGTGTIRLDLNATGTGIADAAGNAIAGGASSTIHTIGTTGGGTGGAASGTRVIAVTVPANGTYTKGQDLVFTVRFSARVRVIGGDDDDDDEKKNKDKGKSGKDDAGDEDSDELPYFTWSAVVSSGQRGSSGNVNYVSGGGTDTLTFRYKVRKDDLAPNGITLGTSMRLPQEVELRDAATNAVITTTNLALSWSQNPLPGVLLGAGVNGLSGKQPQVIVLKPLPAIGVGESIILDATTSSGLPIRWELVSGNATLVGNVLTPRNRGAIVLRATQGGSASFDPATIMLNLEVREKRNDRLVNLSSRLRVTGGDASRAVVAGFFVTGTAPKQILVRAIGPGLAGFGIRDALAQPRLQLRDSTGRLVAENEGWMTNGEMIATFDRVGAFRLNSGSRDAAILVALAPGSYTAQVTANGNGITLVEVYDASTGLQLATEQLVNISTRGFVDTDDGVLVAGFVVTGTNPKRVLIRGIGPGLTAFGVPNVVADPVLKLYASPNSATPMAQNDNWGTPQPVPGGATPATAAEVTAAAAATGAFPLAGGSKDAAIVVTLNPGNYSAVISGAGNTTGAGLVEVYEVP